MKKTKQTDQVGAVEIVPITLNAFEREGLAILLNNIQHAPIKIAFKLLQLSGGLSVTKEELDTLGVGYTKEADGRITYPTTVEQPINKDFIIDKDAHTFLINFTEKIMKEGVPVNARIISILSRLNNIDLTK